MKKVWVLVLAFTIAFGLGACGDKTGDGTTTAKKADVYFLNFKPEIAKVYDEVAATYQEETGKVVKVVTAASNEYEATLKSEIVKSEYPTVFQINGPIGYRNWSDYCLDLKDTKLYDWLTDKNLAVKADKGVYGIPYTVEGYGIIYNEAIMDQYFKLSGAKVSSIAEINNFAKLKAVVEDMTAKKAELKIEGVFASTSMKGGDQWRWQTHLANIPLYYEWKDKVDFDSPIEAGIAADEIAFSYHENFKNIFDLYTENSVTAKGLLAGKSTEDSMAEFALGKCAMVQNGSWAWSQISEVDGSVVAADDVKFMPIYTGIKGEEDQGICIGTENFFAINAKATKEEQEEAIAFVEWLFESDKGKAFVLGDLGFIAPFSTFQNDEKPLDPLNVQVAEWLQKDEKIVPWCFTAFPSEEFKNVWGTALLSYIQGSQDWNAVVTTVKQAWTDER